jgi:crossover junction endodeoxyribonuclease RuvC
LILGHARGVALLCAARAGLPVFEYAPAQVKRAVGASGAAEKEQVLRLIRSYLGLKNLERLDAADALALALCHLNRSRYNERLAAAGRRVG